MDTGNNKMQGTDVSMQYDESQTYVDAIGGLSCRGFSTQILKPEHGWTQECIGSEYTKTQSNSMVMPSMQAATNC